MTDLDQRVRDRLRSDADGFLTTRSHPPTMSPAVLGRIRRRRAGTLGVLALGVAALAAGAIGIATGAWRPVADDARPGASSTDGSAVTAASVPSIPGEEWPVIWPEMTLEAARQAEETWASRTPSGPSRLDANSTAAEYVETALWWTEIGHVAEASSIEGNVARLVLLCGSCQEDTLVTVTLARLPLPEPSHIWFVTGLAAPDTAVGADIEADAVRALMQQRATALTSRFLEARIRGAGAARYLSPVAATAYESHRRGLYLYGSPTDEPDMPGHPDGHPSLAYGGFDILGIPLPRTDGTLEITVSIDVVEADGTLTGPAEGRAERLAIAPFDGELRIVSAEQLAG